MEHPLLIEQLRRQRTRLLKAYVLHVGWFFSTCAFAASDATQIGLTTSLLLTLVTVVPVLVYSVSAECSAWPARSPPTNTEFQ